MDMRSFNYAVIVLLLAVAGCNSNRQPDYFPFEAGVRKFMRVSTRTISDSDTTETTEVRLASVMLGERELPQLGKVWIVETPRDSGPSSYSYFRKTKEAVLQLVPRREGPPAEMVFLSLPLENGKFWYESEAKRQRLEVVGQETVETEAGEFPDCYKVAVIRRDADWAMHQWFAPGVGPVKWESRSVWEKDGVKHEQYRSAELVRHGTTE